jgi:peptidoglycan/LPS O-acetylase OafA/YrhL
MVSLGQQIANSKSNNLNSIRLLLALSVILTHSFPLSLGGGYGGPAKIEPLNAWTHQQEQFGSVAVDLFFFISGMLITASWLRSKSMPDFLMKRVLRIYPGFIAAVGLSGMIALIFCPDFRHGIGFGISWSFQMLQDWLYLTYRSLDQKGIFENNPFTSIANGSLWTIQTEFRCYLLVAVIGLFCCFKQRALILLGTFVVFLAYSKSLLQGHDAAHFDRRFLTYFLFGTCAWLWRDRILFSKWLVFGSLIALIAASQFKPWFSIILTAAGGYCTLWLGYGPRLAALEWTGRTDLSYGTYLYSWPVQQLVAMHESLRIPWINFLIATPLTLALAWVSWHAVEKRFLAMKNISRKDIDPGAEIQTAPALCGTAQSGLQN